MKDIVARCMQWNSVSVSQATTQKCVEAVEGNCAAKMLTPIGTREERLCRETRQRNSLQIVEIPPITPQVEEHRLHQLECQHCGTLTRAELPSQVNLSGYGPGFVATVAVLSGVYRHSQRMVQSAMQDLFGVSLCLGSVNRLRQEGSLVVVQPVEEAQQYVQQQPVVGVTTKRNKTRQPWTTQLLSTTDRHLREGCLVLSSFFSEPMKSVGFKEMPMERMNVGVKLGYG